MTSKNNLNLPSDFVNYLSGAKNRQLDSADSEAGVVTLHRLADLRLGTVHVDSEESPLQEDDPNAEGRGAYEVPAVSLTAACEGFDPEGILVWLPNEEMFGSWDCDHYDLFVFPGATWADIAANPTLYVDAQWDSDRTVGEYFKPYPKYPFKPK